MVPCSVSGHHFTLNLVQDDKEEMAPFVKIRSKSHLIVARQKRKQTAFHGKTGTPGAFSCWKQSKSSGKRSWQWQICEMLDPQKAPTCAVEPYTRVVNIPSRTWFKVCLLSPTRKSSSAATRFELPPVLFAWCFKPDGISIH